MNNQFSQLFSGVRFYEKDHAYKINGQRATSVTQKVAEFKPPFPREEIAGRTARKEGKTVEQVLAEWDKKGEDGRNLGTAVHAYIAGVLQGWVVYDDPILALNAKVAEQHAFDNFWTLAQREFEIEEVELIIGSSLLKLAGTVDAILKNDRTGQLHIFDWKTGKFNFRNNFGETLLPPFRDLDHAEFEHYSLQVSLYRLILETSGVENLGDSYLVHLDKSGHHIYKANDYRERWAGLLGLGVDRVME